MFHTKPLIIHNGTCEINERITHVLFSNSTIGEVFSKINYLKLWKIGKVICNFEFLNPFKLSHIVNFWIR